MLWRLVARLLCGSIGSQRGSANCGSGVAQQYQLTTCWSTGADSSQDQSQNSLTVSCSVSSPMQLGIAMTVPSGLETYGASSRRRNGRHSS